MRTAVLLSGQFRSGLQCLPSVHKHLLSHLGNYDVYAHIALDGDANDVRLYQPNGLKLVEQPTLDEKNYIHQTGRQVYGVQGVLRQLWSIEESYRLCRAYGNDYDWYIRLRPDTQFFNDIEPLEFLNPNYVYLPKFHNWWGYNDRFAIIGAKWAKAYHNRYSALDDYISQGGIFHPETNLKWTLDRANCPIARTGMVFDTVRKDGNRLSPEYYSSCGDEV